MHADGKPVTTSQLCRWFGMPRSTFYYRPVSPKPRQIDRGLEQRILRIKNENPRYGLRMIHAVLRRDTPVNRKKVHRIIKYNGWQVRKLRRGYRPRVQGRISRREWSNHLWAIDTTHVFCGRNGWCHLTAVIDCADRQIVGWRFSDRGVATVVAAALEDGLRARRIAPKSPECPMLRSDNGLVFGSRAFSAVVSRYGIQQEFITPYSPEQNGIIERFFRTLKEECVWQQRFATKDQAFFAIAKWIDKYHAERPHSALGYLTPDQFRTRLAA